MWKGKANKMTVILVLGTFLAFILIDLFLNRKQQTVATTQEAAPAGPQLLSSAIIDGIAVPDQLRYHPGHTWLTVERAKFVRVGADGLAAKHFGVIDNIEIPQPGRWVRQGQKAFTLISGTERFELVSPAEGEVTEINPEVMRDPSLLLKDPYGKGWLVKVNMPDPELVERNLLPRSIVRTWMREEIREWRASRPVANVIAVNER